jgi:hypothetical protein
MRDATPDEVFDASRTGGKIRYNPPAGTVRVVELDGAWMQSWNKLVDDENVMATKVIYEKRIFGLAKQTAAGLSLIGVKFEMTTLAAMIKDALVYKRGEMKPTVSAQRRGEYEKASAVLDAVMAYDLEKAANLLGIPPPVPKTFGNDATKR